MCTRSIPNPCCWAGQCMGQYRPASGAAQPAPLAVAPQGGRSLTRKGGTSLASERRSTTWLAPNSVCERQGDRTHGSRWAGAILAVVSCSTPVTEQPSAHCRCIAHLARRCPSKQRFAHLPSVAVAATRQEHRNVARVGRRQQQRQVRRLRQDGGGARHRGWPGRAGPGCEAGRRGCTPAWPTPLHLMPGAASQPARLLVRQGWEL